MLPASLAAWRAGVHGDADVGLGQRRGVVGAVARHGDELAALLLLADVGQLGLRRGLGDEVVDAGLGGDGRGGQRVVAGDHHRADAHAPAAASKRSRMPSLTMSFSSTTPSARLPSATTQRRGALARDGVDELVELARARAAGVHRRPRLMASARALAQAAAVEVDAAHARLRREGDEACAGRCEVVLAQVEALLGAGRRSSGPRASRRPGDESCAARRARAPSTPCTGRNAAAWRLPMVIVPVLSSSRGDTSPAASTALPDLASMLRAPGGPCRRCRWPRAGRRWWSG